MSVLSIYDATSPTSVREKTTPHPVFSFVSKFKKIFNVDEPNTDMYECIKLELLMDPENPAFKYSRQFAISRIDIQMTGSSWWWPFCEIENLMPLNERTDKTRMFDIE
jgi:hypothetical protein